MRYDRMLKRLRAAEEKFEMEVRGILREAFKEDAATARAILDRGEKSAAAEVTAAMRAKAEKKGKAVARKFKKSKAERMVISKRMKAYWAAQRKMGTHG